MPSYNKVTLMGNLTRDPELRELSTGSNVCEFGIAINEAYTDKDGNKQELTHFVDVEAWNRQGEIIAEYFTKGSPIFIDGALKYESWEAEDGSKRSRLRVRLIRFVFINSKNNESEPGTSKREPRDDNFGDIGF